MNSFGPYYMVVGNSRGLEFGHTNGIYPQRNDKKEEYTQGNARGLQYLPDNFHACKDRLFEVVSTPARKVQSIRRQGGAVINSLRQSTSETLFLPILPTIRVGTVANNTGIH